MGQAMMPCKSFPTMWSTALITLEINSNPTINIPWHVLPVLVGCWAQWVSPWQANCGELVGSLRKSNAFKYPESARNSQKHVPILPAVLESVPLPIVVQISKSRTNSVWYNLTCIVQTRCLAVWYRYGQEFIGCQQLVHFLPVARVFM